MSTYFGYVEREADSYINWAEIGKGISDTVNKIDQIREDKKAALDQVSKDFQSKLSEYPTGQDVNANRFAYKYSDDASQFMLMQDRLLKSGKLKMKDYLNARQNIMDDTDSAFGMVKAYQEMFGKKMDQYKNGEISIEEVNNLAYIEKFGGFKDSDLFINPLDGSLTVGIVEEKDVDGKKVRTLKDGQQNLMSIGALKQLMNTPIPKYDAEKQSTVIAKSVGKQIDVMVRDGIIVSRENITSRVKNIGILDSKDSNKISNALVDSAIDPTNYTITTEKTEVDPATKTEKTVSSTETFRTEQEVAEKYVQLKDKSDLTRDEKAFVFKVEKSLKVSNADRQMVLDFKEAEARLIESNIGTDFNYMSALVDNNVLGKDGKPYETTWDKKEAEKNPNLIYKEIDSRGTVFYKLTPEQKKAAVEAVRTLVNLKYDEEEKLLGTTKTAEQIREENALKQRKLDIEEKKVNKPRETKQWEYEAAKKQQEPKGFAKFIADLYSGTDAEVETAIQHFRGDERLAIKDIRRTDEGIVITYDDDEEKTFTFYTSGTDDPVGNVEFYNRISEALIDDKEKDRRGYIERGREFLKPYTGHPNLNIIENDPISQYGMGLPNQDEVDRIIRRRQKAGGYVTGQIGKGKGKGGGVNYGEK